MAKIIVKGFLSTELKKTKYGYYFSIAENTGKNNTQFYNCFVSSITAEEMIGCKVKKGSLIEIIGILALSTYQKEVKAEVNAKISVKHWEFVSIFSKFSKTKKEENNNATENKNEIRLEDETLPF